MTRSLAVLVVLCAAALASAAPPVEVPAEVKGDVGAFITVRAKTEGRAVRFVALDPGLNVFPADLLSDRKATVVTASAPGTYRLLAYSSVRDDPTEPAIVTVVIGDPARPKPKPPQPKPPTPAPEPKPKPTPVKVLRVALVHESGVTLTQAQFSTLYAREVRDWLGANASAWRLLDKDAAPTDSFKDFWDRGKGLVTAVPCVLVEADGKVRALPLPATPEALIETLKKIKEGR